MSLPHAKQDYSPRPQINGVKVVDLKAFTDDGGYFLELARLPQLAEQHFPGFVLQQLNYSEMDPGVIKAWHLHEHQDDIWFVPPSHRLLVALRDVRDGSESKDVTMRLVAGRGKAQLIFIPRGVAHGAANLWQQPAAILYFVNQQFTADPDKNDEYRLPWDQFGAEVWEMTKG